MRAGMIRAGAAALAAAAWMGVALGQKTPPPPVPTSAAIPAEPAIVATVGGEPIPLAKVDAFIRDKLKIALLPDDQLRELRTQVASDMVDELLLKQFLHKEAPKVEPAEIDKYVAAFSKNLTLRGKTLAGFLGETNQTEAELRDAWTTVLMLNGYVKKTGTEEQLKQYYQANKAYFDRVEVKVRHILVRAEAQPLPGVREAALKKIQGLRADILAGRLDFATAAKLHSQCPSAVDGGDLGYIPRKGMLDEKLSAAAFTLKAGDISDVIETDLGYHLVQATDRKPGTPSDFEKCIDDVRDAMAEDLRVDLMRRLRLQTPVKITVAR